MKLKDENQFLGYVLKDFIGSYYLSHTQPRKNVTNIQHVDNFSEAYILPDKQAVKQLLEQLGDVIDCSSESKGYQLFRLFKRGSRNYLLPATEEDLEELPMSDYY
jgi:hypothetical protein